MKAAYYAKVIRVIAFQLKVNDAVPPFFTVPPPPDDLEFNEDDIELILGHWLRLKFGASLEIRFEQETMQ
jgi:hypothetical protein